MNFGFQKIKKAISSKQSTIKGAAIRLVVTVFLSRILGLVRDRLLAGSFGAGTDLDIYFAAFRIPDLVFNILFAGGVVVSLLPIFAEYQQKNKKESWKIINIMINFFLISFVVFFIIFFAFTPQIISSTISEFSPSAKDATVALSRMLFISVLFFGISSILSTVLNYFNRFVAYSLAPIFYNLGIIFGIVFFVPYFGIYGAGIGVVIGSLAHLLIQLPVAIKCGFKYVPILDFKHPAIKNLFTLMLPRAIAASASQINFIIATAIAAGVGTGAISVFYLSNNLRYVPIGIVGISFATAAFPVLSKFWAEGNKSGFYKSFNSVFVQTLYIALPIGFLIFVLRESIVETILRSGQFGSASIEITAACLGMYFISTFAQCLVPLILRGFFSLKDTITPTIIALVFVIISYILSNVFVFVFQGSNMLVDSVRFIFQIDGAVNLKVLGLAFGFNLALLLEFLLLIYFFYRKVGDFGIKGVFISFIKMFVAGIIMAIGSSFTLYFLSNYFNPIIKKAVYLPDIFYSFSNLCLTSIVAVLIYLLFTVIFHCKEVDFYKDYVLRKLKIRKNEN
ncbi:murein biosynthesis integral membrane protein MurJ [bacterium]|jgi:putative peptidoglycan lipid II flippase|nr:murein biosynthesis integral membrane protein MurJ [bacterium]